MIGRFAVVASLLFSLSVVAFAGADSPPSDPQLAALVEEALRVNPDVLAASEGLSAARQRPAQARALSNPMVSAGYTNDGWRPTLGSRDMTTLAIMGSQELPYPGKRRLRGEIAESETREIEQRLERVKLGVAASVRRSHAGLLLARELLVLAGQRQDAWEQIEEIVRARYALGQGTQQDVVKAQVEVSRSGLLMIERGADEMMRMAELNGLLARPADQPLDTAGSRLSMVPVTETLEAAIERLSALSPEVKMTSLTEGRGSLEVDLARTSFKPDFNVQAAYMNRGGLDPMWQAAIGVSLPLYRKRLRAQVAEAEFLRASARRTTESVRLVLRSRTQQRLIALSAAERSLFVFDERIIPQDRLAVDSALASYRSAQLPFVAVLESATALYDDLAARLILMASHVAVRATLDEASPADQPLMASSFSSGAALDSMGGGRGAAPVPMPGGRQ